MVGGNGGEMPLYKGQVKHLPSAQSSSARQKQLQMQFDAWMNSINIAKIPESVCKEMEEKGKGKLVTDASGAKATTLNNNKSSIPIPTSQLMQRSGSFAKEPQLSATFKQVESNASSGEFANVSTNFAQNYQLGIPQGSNHVIAKFADAHNYMGTPNMEFNNNKEGNHEDRNGNNESNDNDDDDIVIIGPPPPVQVPSSSPRILCDSNVIFPPLDPLGDDLPWTEKIKETPIWEWDHLYFP